MKYGVIPIFVLAAASVGAGCTHTQLGHPAAAQTSLPATIVGDIEWNKTIWDLPLDSSGNADAAKVDAQFTITACERAPAPAGQFSSPCHTVGTGHITSVKAKALLTGPPDKVAPSTVFAARYRIPVIGLSTSESVSVSIEPGVAFKTQADKNSLTYAIPSDRSTMPLSGGENVVLNWNIENVPNVCEE